jgi:putative thioredoxin
MPSMDVTHATFAELVIEASRRAPVLVDFWAPWCAPCRALTPVLERLVDESHGKFILAKVNTEENPGLAMQYGVRGIPNVKAFIGGQMVGEFIGALPEADVRRFLQRFLPSTSEELRARAAAMSAKGKHKQALSLLEQALREDPRNEAAQTDKAEVLLALDRSEEAAQVLEGLSPAARREDRVARLIARTRFRDGAPDRWAELGLRVKQNPQDLGARLDLARALVAKNEYESALSELLEVVRRDRNFRGGEGRTWMLSVFDLLGRDHPLVGKYRRLLASALN